MEQDGEIRVVIADEQRIVLHAVAKLLQNMRGVTVVGVAGSGEELVSALRAGDPQVVLSELNLPGIDRGALVPTIRKAHAAASAVILSMHETADEIRQAVASGASGYVFKGSSPYELETAIRRAARGDSYFGAAVSRLLLQRAAPTPAEQLTRRQLQIVRLIASGMSSKEIGFELGLSSKTVDVHRVRLMGRVGIDHIAGLTRYAVRHGLVQA